MSTSLLEAMDAAPPDNAPEITVEPLSRAQRGLWFLARLRPGSSAYNLATAARVHGELATAEIRAFFQGKVDRHAVLRSTFRR